MYFSIILEDMYTYLHGSDVLYFLSIFIVLYFIISFVIWISETVQCKRILLLMNFQFLIFAKLCSNYTN